MEYNLIERLLASTERHIADGEQHIAQQYDIIGRLEDRGLGSCATAGMARDLLQQMETTLDLHLIERERLRDYLQRTRGREPAPATLMPGTPPFQPSPGRSGRAPN